MKAKKIINTLIATTVITVGGLVVLNRENTLIQGRDTLGAQTRTYYDSLTIKDIEVGGGHAGAVINDGSRDHLYMWGDNDYGQLGDGTVNDSTIPIEITPTNGIDGTIKELSLGADFSGAVVNDGTTDHIYMWGDNSSGQLAIQNGNVAVKTPTQVSGISGNIKQLELSSSYAGAIVSNGGDTLYTWGNNDYGQLGNGNTTSTSTPYEVGLSGTIERIDFSSWETARAGRPSYDTYSTSAAVVNNGGNDSLFTWGSNYHGKAGNISSSEYKTPHNITTNLPITGQIEDVAFGYSNGLAVVNSGGTDHIIAWGGNVNYQVMPTEIEKYAYPQDITYKLPVQGDVKKIESGNIHSGAIINSNGSDHLITWGGNTSGQVGYVTPTGYINYKEGYKDITSNLPIQGTIKDIAFGSENSLATVTKDGRDYIISWGSNKNKQLGYDSTKDGVLPSANIWINDITTSHPFTLTQSKIKNVVPDTNSVKFDIVSNSDESDLNPATLSAKLNGSDKEVEIISSNPAENKNTFRVKGLNPSTLYSDASGNPIKLSVDGFSSSVSMPAFTTLDQTVVAPTIDFAFVDPASVTSTTANLRYSINNSGGASLNKIEVVDKDTNKILGQKTGSFPPASEITLTNLESNHLYDNVWFELSYGPDSEIVESKVNNFTTPGLYNPEITDIQVLDVTETSAQIYFMIQNLDNTALSRVEVLDNTGKALAIKNNPTEYDSVLISGLTPNTEYSGLKLKLYYAGGTDEETIPTFTTSSFEEPVINSITASNPTSNSVDISYSIDKKGENPQLLNIVDTATNTSLKQIAYPLDNDYFTMTGLLPEHTYNLSAQLILDGDVVDSKDINEFTTLPEEGGEPYVETATVDLITSNSATINYTINASDDYDLKSLYVIDSADNTVVEKVDSPLKEGQIELTDLKPNTLYNLKLVVSYEGGNSDPYDVTFITLDIEAPIIESAIADSIGSTKADINYVITSNDDVTLDKIEITDPENSDELIAYMDDPEETGTIKLTGLEPEKEYSLQMTLFYNDDQQTEPYNIPSFKTTEMDKVTEFTGITVPDDEVTDTTATIYYEINKGDASELNYIFYTDPEDTSNYIFGQSSPNESGSFTMTGLTPGQNYTGLKLALVYTDADGKQQTVTGEIPSFTTDALAPKVKVLNKDDIVTTETTATIEYEIENDSAASLTTLLVMNVENNITMGQLNNPVAGKNDITIKNLEPGKDYTMQFTLVYDGFNSAVTSEEFTFKTKEAIIPDPTEPTIDLKINGFDDSTNSVIVAYAITADSNIEPKWIDVSWGLDDGSSPKHTEIDIASSYDYIGEKELRVDKTGKYIINFEVHYTDSDDPSITDGTFSDQIEFDYVIGSTTSPSYKYRNSSNDSKEIMPFDALPDSDYDDEYYGMWEVNDEDGVHKGWGLDPDTYTAEKFSIYQIPSEGFKVNYINILNENSDGFDVAWDIEYPDYINLEKVELIWSPYLAEDNRYSPYLEYGFAHWWIVSSKDDGDLKNSSLSYRYPKKGERLYSEYMTFRNSTEKYLLELTYTNEDTGTKCNSTIYLNQSDLAHEDYYEYYDKEPIDYEEGQITFTNSWTNQNNPLWNSTSGHYRIDPLKWTPYGVTKKEAYIGISANDPFFIDNPLTSLTLYEMFPEEVTGVSDEYEIVKDFSSDELPKYGETIKYTIKNLNPGEMHFYVLEYDCLDGAHYDKNIRKNIDPYGPPDSDLEIFDVLGGTDSFGTDQLVYSSTSVSDNRSIRYVYTNPEEVKANNITVNNITPTTADIKYSFTDVNETLKVNEVAKNYYLIHDVRTFEIIDENSEVIYSNDIEIGKEYETTLTNLKPNEKYSKYRIRVSYKEHTPHSDGYNTNSPWYVELKTISSPYYSASDLSSGSGDVKKDASQAKSYYYNDVNKTQIYDVPTFTTPNFGATEVNLLEGSVQTSVSEHSFSADVSVADINFKASSDYYITLRVIDSNGNIANIEVDPSVVTPNPRTTSDSARINSEGIYHLNGTFDGVENPSNTVTLQYSVNNGEYQDVITGEIDLWGDVPVTEPDGLTPEQIAEIIAISLLILLLLLLLLLLLFRKKYKIKQVIWINDKEVLILVNHKKQINKKVSKLGMYDEAKGIREDINIEFLPAAKGDVNTKNEIKILLRNLGNKTYKNLSFKTTSYKRGEEITKTWKRVHGKIEPFEKIAKREKILSEATSVQEIELLDVYGVGPVTKEYFVKNDYASAHKILKMKQKLVTDHSFVKNLPGLNGETYEIKQERLKHIIKELEFLKKEINRIN